MGADTYRGKPLSHVPLAVEEVGAGLFRIEVAIGTPPGTVNVFLEVGSRGVLLIDAASDYPAARTALAEAFRQVGMRLEDITDIVISHIHIDHYGMAGWLADLSGAPVWIHEGGSFELWRHWNPEDAANRFAAFAISHGATVTTAQRIAALDDWRRVLTLPATFRQLVSGQTWRWANREWKVLFTPGHASGHICLWNPTDAILVGGDQLLSKAHAAVRWFNDELPDPLGSYLRGVRQLRRLGAKLLLPGHGPIVHDVAPLANATEQHHLSLVATLSKELDCPRSAMQLVEMLHGDPSDFHLRIALTEVVAALRYLEIQGKVVSMLHGNIIHFGNTSSSDRTWAWGAELAPADIPAPRPITEAG